MSTLTIHWPNSLNEHGRPMLWFGAWLVGAEGAEAGWFYSGRGGEESVLPVPAGVTGLRLRRWPNEGLEPEYADIFELSGVTVIDAGTADYDTRQPFSWLPEDFS